LGPDRNEKEFNFAIKETIDFNFVFKTVVNEVSAEVIGKDESSTIELTGSVLGEKT
jgi:hypothetical protein